MDAASRRSFRKTTPATADLKNSIPRINVELIEDDAIFFRLCFIESVRGITEDRA